MASPKIFVTGILMVAAFVIPSIMATDHVVGDENGWKLNFDYQTWAQGKEFKVGDRLIFKYTKGLHNVEKVDGAGFRQCVASDGTEALTSGKDVITLATPGNKWYICGVSNHCESGNLKLTITVQTPLQVEAPALSPGATSPTSTATINSSVGYVVMFMSVIFVALEIVLFVTSSWCPRRIDNIVHEMSKRVGPILQGSGPNFKVRLNPKN
ncbi:hypothetical protein ACFE04_014408 [Oxalis oulophora]